MQAGPCLLSDFQLPMSFGILLLLFVLGFALFGSGQKQANAWKIIGVGIFGTIFIFLLILAAAGA